MSDWEQTHCSAFSDPNAATYACTASTHYSSPSETTPATAGDPEPDTGSASHSATTTMSCSPSGCDSSPADCSGTPRRGVAAPACCDSDRVAGYTPSSYPSAPATGHCAASSSVHAGASGQPSRRRSFKRDCRTERKQPKCSHPTAGQYLPTSACSEGGNNQSDTLSAYCNYPGAQSGCNRSSESSSWHSAGTSAHSSACCSSSCSACNVHSDTRNQLDGRHSSPERWREAAGAHSPAPRSTPSQQSSSSYADVLFSTSSSNSTYHHCEWPGFCLATHEDL